MRLGIVPGWVFGTSAAASAIPVTTLLESVPEGEKIERGRLAGEIKVGATEDDEYGGAALGRLAKAGGELVALALMVYIEVVHPSLENDLSRLGSRSGTPDPTNALVAKPSTNAIGPQAQQTSPVRLASAWHYDGPWRRSQPQGTSLVGRISRWHLCTIASGRFAR